MRLRMSLIAAGRQAIGVGRLDACVGVSGFFEGMSRFLCFYLVVSKCNNTGGSLSAAAYQSAAIWPEECLCSCRSHLHVLVKLCLVQGWNMRLSRRCIPNQTFSVFTQHNLALPAFSTLLHTTSRCDLSRGSNCTLAWLWHLLPAALWSHARTALHMHICGKQVGSIHCYLARCGAAVALRWF